LATQGENILKSHFAFVDQPFFYLQNFSKKKKKKKKKREKENEVLFDGWFSIHKSFEFFL